MQVTAHSHEARAYRVESSGHAGFKCGDIVDARPKATRGIDMDYIGKIVDRVTRSFHKTERFVGKTLHAPGWCR